MINNHFFLVTSIFVNANLKIQVKFRLSILFLLINILISQTLKAQNKDLKYTYSFGVESFAGFIVRHHADMGHNG